MAWLLFANQVVCLVKTLMRSVLVNMEQSVWRLSLCLCKLLLPTAIRCQGGHSLQMFYWLINRCASGLIRTGLLPCAIIVKNKLLPWALIHIHSLGQSCWPSEERPSEELAKARKSQGSKKIAASSGSLEWLKIQYQAIFIGGLMTNTTWTVKTAS